MIAYVNSGGTPAPGTTATATQAYTATGVVAGNLLVVFATFADNNGTTTCAITDSQGNTYAGNSKVRLGNTSSQMFYSRATAAGSNTVTMTLSASSQYPSITVSQYSGVIGTGNPTDVVPVGQGGTSTTPTGASLTTTAANDLIVSCVSGNPATAAGSGFTLRQAINYQSVEDQILASPGTVTPTFTAPNGPWVVHSMSFKAAGAVFAVGAPSVAAGPSAGTNRITSPAASGGSAPYTYQFQRATVNGGTAGTYANIGSASTATTYDDTAATPGTTYSYQTVVTDSTSATTNSSATSFTTLTPGFAVTTNPGSMALMQGQSLTLGVTLTATGGYTGTDTLSCTGLPTGVTASFSPSSVSNAVGASTLTLTAAGNAVTGFLEIGVQGSDGTLTVSAPVALTVLPPSGIVYPTVSNVLDSDLVTITRSGTTDQVAASVLKAYLAS